MSDQPVKWTTYLAGGMENVSKQEMMDFREDLEKKLDHPDLLVYSPVKQEASKVGTDPGEHIKNIQGLKRAGHWDIFYEKMWKIWFGNINPNTDLIHLGINLRMRKHIDGNRRRDIGFWGDFEAVVRSDFIIVYHPTSIKTVGTHFEVCFAFLFRIPIYLIVPDAPPAESNSSLMFGTQISNNKEIKVYRTINDCVKAIKEDYKLK